MVRFVTLAAPRQAFHAAAAALQQQLTKPLDLGDGMYTDMKGVNKYFASNHFSIAIMTYSFV